MFDAQSENYEFEFTEHTLSNDCLDIRSIMQQSAGIPKSVATTTITRKFERLLDFDELDRLTNPDSLKRQDAIELEQLRVRRKMLDPYLGSFLTCVLIRLPGICYTIEIDLVQQRVVHWEYQTDSI